MLYSREMNSKIRRIHERSLRLVYSDKTSAFIEFIYDNKFVSGHHKNIPVLAAETYKQ